MSDLVKGIIGGGWGLLVGWIFPSAINVTLFRFFVVPHLPCCATQGLLHLDAAQQSLIFLGIAVVVGLLFAAVQTHLYRTIEGYIGWQPQGRRILTAWLAVPVRVLLVWWQSRHLHRKQVLLGRLDLIELSRLDSSGHLRPELHQRLAEVRADDRLTRWATDDARRNDAQLSLLRERLRRYPTDDSQIVPTRLGNAIRRIEEYGYNRFRLDSQLLWYELNAVAPEQTRKQVEQARTTVDFMICLLYGHLIVATSAVVAIIVGASSKLSLGLVGVVLTAATYIWYRLAVAATDDWAGAARALVNLGRKPLADGMGLELPATLEDERQMWSAVSRTAARPHDDISGRTDKYRAASSKATSAP